MSLAPLNPNIGQFIRTELKTLGFSPRAYTTLEQLPQLAGLLLEAENDTREEINTIEGAPYAVWETPTDKLTNTRLLSSSSDIALSVSAGEITYDLTETGVTSGSYGDASHLVTFAVDAKGRVLSAATLALETGNITETTKLFFTQARARTSLSGSSGITYNSTTGAFSLDPAFVRGLLSATAPVTYDSSTGAIGFTAPSGFSGTGAYTNFTFVNGLCTAAS